MKKKLFTIIITLCFMFVPLMVNAEENTFFITNNWPATLTTQDSYQINIAGTPSEPLVWKSTDETVCSVDQNGLVTPLKDGGCIVSASTSNEERYIGIVVSAFGTLQEEVNNFLGRLPNTINLDVTKDINVVNDENFGEEFTYASEYLYTYTFENYTKNSDISFNFDCNQNNNICKVKTYKSIYAFYNNSMHYLGSVESNVDKDITVNYATGNETDKTVSLNAVNKIKDIYNVYINDVISNQSTFSDNVLFKNAAIHDDVGAGIKLKFDSRAGDDTPGQAAALGFVSVGKNGVYYVAKNVEFYQILKTPELKGNKLEALKEFIETYLLKDNQKVTVEKTDEVKNGKDIYKITIEEREENNLISMLFSPFVMKVKADTSYTIYTAIEEDTNMILENNTNNIITPPKTGDLGLVYIGLLVISSIGVIVLSKKVRI